MSNMLSHLKKESMHHAFVIEGDTLQTRPILFDFLKKEFGMDTGHNDLVLLDRGDFGIENVQEIVDVNSRKPTAGIYKVIVVGLHSISHQAQNAILKTLEEPRPGTFIFILTNTSAIFLPTILSRVQVVRSTGAEIVNSSSTSKKETLDNSRQSKKDIKRTEILNAQLFLQKPQSARLAQVKEILDLKSDEEIGDAEIFKFVQEIEKLSVGFAQKNNDIKTITLIAQIFTKVEDYMRDTSSSKKLLLEYMALRIPVC
jgi:DNA polymerase III delta prime subunit